jgi:hypothetical protein
MKQLRVVVGGTGRGHGRRRWRKAQQCSVALVGRDLKGWFGRIAIVVGGRFPWSLVRLGQQRSTSRLGKGINLPNVTRGSFFTRYPRVPKRLAATAVTNSTGLETLVACNIAKLIKRNASDSGIARGFRVGHVLVAGGGRVAENRRTVRQCMKGDAGLLAVGIAGCPDWAMRRDVRPCERIMPFSRTVALPGT